LLLSWTLPGSAFIFSWRWLSSGAPCYEWKMEVLVCIYPVLVASYLPWLFVHRRNKGMPMLSVPIEHNVNSDRVCERG
jgi:hypothetical protein